MSPILTLLEVYAFAHLFERVKLAWIFGSHKASAVFRFGYSLKASLFSSLSILVMECNKDEALRAKQIAEKKMETNDFEGARKVALKAQNLFPELENIRQLLSVCDVHCSAQNTLTGSEKDWYGILQVERLADDLTVKKQYRRLALFLHPDKNQFPGAEAAFKLICEAYALLSDPEKKSLYDTKLRVIVRSAPVHPPPHHINKNSQFSMQFTPVFTDHFSRLSQHHATQSNNTRMGIFCTICPYCSLKHQYERKFLNTVLHCQKCFKNFLGYEIGSRKSGQGGTQVHADLGVSQSAGFQERVGPNECQFSVGIQNMASSVVDGGSQQNTSFKAVQPSRVSNGERVQGTAKVTRNFQAKAAGNGNVNTSRGGRRTGKLYRDTTDSKKRDLKNKSRKGNKRYVVESSDTCNSSSESDIELVNQPVDLASIPSHVQFPRRSSRKRTNVSYHEDDNDDDVNIALERSQESNADCSRTQNKDIGSSRVGENPEGKVGDQDEKVKVREETSVPPENGATPIEIDSDSDLDSCFSPDTDNNSYECAEPEFSDFDKARDENCFAVDQFWACYDETDGMPRFYAKVKKVSASPFELSITWLEGDLMNKNPIDVPLPLGCGCFKLGATIKTSRRLMFSHQIHFDRGKKRGSFLLHPSQTEVWALFKDSDLNWSSNPENYNEFKYEIVEVLSDFIADSGIRVSYLNKVGGFVSLFQRSSQGETDSFLIRPNELYRFSHNIPFSKMTGSERVGVPAGSFELDPASLPTNPYNLCYPGKDKVENKNVEHGIGYMVPNPPLSSVMKSAGSSSKETRF